MKKNKVKKVTLGIAALVLAVQLVGIDWSANTIKAFLAGILLPLVIIGGVMWRRFW